MRNESCAFCSAPLTQPTGKGRPRQFCSKRCGRLAAWGNCGDCGEQLLSDVTGKRKQCRTCGIKARQDEPGELKVFANDGSVRAVVLVDLDDWERFRGHSVKLAAGFYPVVRVDGRDEYMHRVILGLRRGEPMAQRCCDHINRDPLDNRRANLRIVTMRENCANRGGRFEKQEIAA